MLYNQCYGIIYLFWLELLGKYLERADPKVLMLILLGGTKIDRFPNGDLRLIYFPLPNEPSSCVIQKLNPLVIVGIKRQKAWSS